MALPQGFSFFDAESLKKYSKKATNTPPESDNINKEGNMQKVLELWSDVSGSYEDTRNKLKNAIRKSASFASNIDDYVTLEATFPDMIIVRVTDYNTYSDKYYQANWQTDDSGNILFTNITSVVPETVMKAISEEKEFVGLMFPERVELNETIQTTIKFDSRMNETGEKRYVGKVEIAQKAERKNENNRKYPKDVMRTAITEVQQKIKDFGPLLMDYIHREKDGANFRDIRETVAVIKSVTFHEDTNNVSLDEIVLIPTQAGKDIMVLLDNEVVLQVSQRGAGFSELVEENGEVYEKVLELHISGWDFTAGGDASVKEARFEFKVISEGRTMNMKDVVTQETLNKAIGDSESRIVNGITNTLKAAGLLKEEKEKEEEKPAKESASPDDPNFEEAANEGQTAAVNSELNEIIATHKIKVAELDAKTAEVNKILQEMQANKDAELLKVNTNKVIGSIMEDAKFQRFSAAQKQILMESVKMDALIGKVKPDDLEAIKNIANETINLEVLKLDRILADAGLAATGFPKRGEGGSGITRTVLTEGNPGGAVIAKLTEAVERRISKKREWWMGDKDPAMSTLDEMMAKYDRIHYHELKKLDEVGEEVTQADIGVRVAMMARVLIPAAWRMITAFQVVDTHSVTARIEDIPIASWLPAEIEDIADAMAAVEVGESGTIATAGVTYSNVPLVSMIRKLKTKITSESIATAMGTAMDPVADAVAGLALDISHRIDRALWWLQIVRGLAYGVTQVTSWTQLTVVPGYTYTFQYATSDKTLWVPYEYVKTYDGNGNPTGAKFVKLFGTTADNSYQEVTVREHGGDNTALVYGAANDYTINWPDGTITLTAAGLAKCATDGTPEAKWSYSTNGKGWSLIPPTGVTGYDHLINLRSAIGQAKVLVGNRNYSQNFLGMSLTNEDRITSGPMFTGSGSTPADILDRLNNVLTFAGLTPIKSSGIPDAWIPLGERGAAVYANQIPFAITGPHVDTTAGDKYYIAEDSSGYEVPVTGKLAVVGIKNLLALT